VIEVNEQNILDIPAESAGVLDWKALSCHYAVVFEQSVLDESIVINLIKKSLNLFGHEMRPEENFSTFAKELQEFVGIRSHIVSIITLPNQNVDRFDNNEMLFVRRSRW